MKSDAIYRIIGGIVLIIFSIAVPLVKRYGSADTVTVLSADPLLIVGCLAIALLGVLVAAAGMRSLKKTRTMTHRISQMAEEQNHVVTVEIAEAVGVHETNVRKRIDEMIGKRQIPAGTRITYSGGEKVVK
jgi:hypothetical protein